MTHVFLDFDGTLADSSQGIYLAFATACDVAGIKPPELEEFSTSIGPPIQVIAKKLMPDIRSEQLETIRATFRAEYDNRYHSNVKWYDGVVDGLKWLASLPDFQLSIVTNKPTRPTINIISDAGIESLFNCVIGIDYRVQSTVGSIFESKSEAIGFALSLADCPREGALYVGDTPSDLQASMHNGIRFCAATYGFHQWQQNELEGTTSKASSFAEVVTALYLGSKH